MKQINEKSNYVATNLFISRCHQQDKKLVKQRGQKIDDTSDVHGVGRLQDLASFTLRRNRPTSAFNQSFSVRKQIVQMLVGRENCRVQPEVEVEDGLLVVNPLHVGPRVLLRNFCMSRR